MFPFGRMEMKWVEDDASPCSVVIIMYHIMLQFVGVESFGRTATKQRI